MNRSNTIAVYGGAFNPPHQGHAQVIRHLAADHTRVLVVPAYRHGHGKVMAPFNLRCQWLKQMLSAMRLPNVELDECESLLGQDADKPVFTWDLLTFLASRERVSSAELSFVIGEDNVATLPRFYRAKELQEQFGILVVNETIGVHSTQIRRQIEQGLPLEKPWMAPGLHEYDFAYYR
jgi:nicotinate-nucleotide adenylyltransferase